MEEEPQIIKEMRAFEENAASNASLSENQAIIQEGSTEFFHHDEIEQNQKETVELMPQDVELYKTLVENLLEGIIILDFKGKILFANSAIAHLFGFDTANEIIGRNALEYIDPKFHGKVIRDQLLVRLGKGGFLDTYQANTKDGGKIWIEGLGCKIKYKGQTANVVFIRDISDRRKTWDRLLKLEKKYRAIAEMSADGILTLDPLGKLTYVNPAFLKMTKQTQEKVLNTVFREYLHEDSVYQFQQLLIESRKKNKEIRNVELELISTDNTSVPVELSIAPITEEKEFTGYICTIHDITERKKMEGEMRKSERLKTEFMNIAAHELKSPVTPIKGYH